MNSWKSEWRTAAADQRPELRPLQDLRHQGPDPEHQLGHARRRRRPQLPEHVSCLPDGAHCRAGIRGACRGAAADPTPARTYVQARAAAISGDHREAAAAACSTRRMRSPDQPDIAQQGAERGDRAGAVWTLRSSLRAAVPRPKLTERRSAAAGRRGSANASRLTGPQLAGGRATTAT